MGNENFLRRVKEQVTGVEQQTSGKRGSRLRHHFRGGGSFSFLDAEKPIRRCSKPGDPHIEERIPVLMHVSSYLMIAALVLMGLQLAYAAYQLAGFIL